MSQKRELDQKKMSDYYPKRIKTAGPTNINTDAASTSEIVTQQDQCLNQTIGSSDESGDADGLSNTSLDASPVGEELTERIELNPPLAEDPPILEQELSIEKINEPQDKSEAQAGPSQAPQPGQSNQTNTQGSNQKRKRKAENNNQAETAGGQADDKYKKTRGFTGARGHEYEYKMAGLIYMRAINNKCKDINLKTNWLEAGKMDDVVFKLETDRGWKTFFMQLKSAGKDINVGPTTFGKSKTPMIKTFIESFIDIKSSKEPDCLFAGNFDDCSFIYYTNAPLEPKQKEAFTKDDTDTEMFKYVESGSNSLVYRFAVGAKANEKINNLLEEYESTDREEFLRKFLVFTGQSTEDNIDDDIKKELKQFGVKDNTIDLVVDKFVKIMVDYWKPTMDGISIKMKDDIHLKAQAEVQLDKVRGITIREENKFRLTIKFEENPIQRVKVECDAHRVVKFVTKGSVEITASKVLQMLKNRKNYIFVGIQSLHDNYIEVLPVWSYGKNMNLLVLIVNEKLITSGNEDKMIAMMAPIIQNENKRLVLISDANNDSNNVFSKLNDILKGNVKIVQDSFNMRQLDVETTDSLMDKLVVNNFKIRM